ncbi:MAG: hypothetical protein ACOCRY_03360, partial [Alkalispirochaetaceae bacterium]
MIYHQESLSKERVPRSPGDGSHEVLRLVGHPASYGRYRLFYLSHFLPPRLLMWGAIGVRPVARWIRLWL